MHQQFAVSANVHVVVGTLFVSGNITIFKQQLTVFKKAKAVGKIDVAGTRGLNFATDERNSGFVSFFYEIFKSRLFIGGNYVSFH